MKARKINPLVIGYVTALALLACMGYIAGDYTARINQKSASPSTNQHFASDVGFVELPRMNMSISSSAGDAGRVRIDMSLEVEKKNLARFEDYQPIITEHLNNYVRNLDIEEIRSPNAVPKLRKELLKEVNTMSFPVPVLDIIFRQFVIM